VSYAAEQGIYVTFFGVDSTRANLDFFDEVYQTALEAGAKEIAVVDTIGIASPEAVTFLMNRIKSWAGDTPIQFHGHNDFGLGTACALAAIKAGAAWVHGTIDGIGERAGNANLPEIALALEVLYGVDSGIRFDKVRAASERLREIANYSLEPWKSVVGQNLFVRETGAVAAQFHLPHAVEPYSSELLDTSRGIRLGKKSGAASITIKAKELGLDVPDDKVAAILELVKKTGIAKRGLVTDDEFKALVAQHV
jgi:isopropylmalate/homocitrate/citramalate synthase